MRATLILSLAGSCLAFGVASRPALAPRSSVTQRVGASAVMGPKSSALPKGWRRVASRSRPGEFSYENIKTGDRFDKLPRNAGGGSFYDDERDTVSRTPWNFMQGNRADDYASVQEA